MEIRPLGPKTTPTNNQQPTARHRVGTAMPSLSPSAQVGPGSRLGTTPRIGAWEKIMPPRKNPVDIFTGAPLFGGSLPRTVLAPNRNFLRLPTPSKNLGNLMAVHTPWSKEIFQSRRPVDISPDSPLYHHQLRPITQNQKAY